MSRRHLQTAVSNELVRFIEDAVPMLVDYEKVTHKCPHCDYPVNYPLIVRDEHVEALQMMLDAAQRYLNKTGVTAEMLADIRAQCIIAIASKKP